MGELRSFRAFKARQRQRSLSYCYRLCPSLINDGDEEDAFIFIKPDKVNFGEDDDSGGGKN